ncbi:MAG: oligopeptide transporter, OPT family [Bacteroidetes bacterium]|nr:oligopeptide transporter, OPT family [Bacteroidota bacterium]MBU2472177.1 oligopeptide transporter, OPT family [Bacteroidota bacterium]
MEPTTRSLPLNAYKELKPGEKYIPVVPAETIIPEVTPWSLTWGLIMAAVFSAAAAYLGLKIGQVFEAAIPIAIIAVGLAAITKRKNALSENVIIQSIGAASGVVVAGAIFTIPALYILHGEGSIDVIPNFWQIFFASLFGGFLGILFLIPFRKYFVQEMHGQFPFPEATATTEVLVAGEKGGQQAKVLVSAALIGGLYDFLIQTFGAWKEVFNSKILPVFDKLSDIYKIETKLNVGAAVLGLGYIVGLKYASIIAAGSFLSWFLLIPVFSYVGSDLTVTLGSTATKLIGQMSADEIFRAYVRHIGIGGIAMAGMIGIFKSRKIIGGAFKLAFEEIFRKKHIGERTVVRTDKELSMGLVVGLIAVLAFFIFIFFAVAVVDTVWFAVTALLIVLIVAFLFTTVSARAIAIVGTNPVSGMTLMTLILSSFILVLIGLKGSAGMVSALIIGGVVCTALSMAGGFITDLKIGYWLGTTPIKQQSYKFLGTIVAAATVGLVIMLLNETYGFVGEGALVAPQANAMAAVIKPLMSEMPAPWALYIAGALIALTLQMINVPPLAFALGMYIPLELNTPILLGGLIAHIVSTRTKEEGLNNARRERGTLIASGFIAGGAIMGVVSATLKYFNFNYENFGWHWSETFGGELLAVVMFLAIAAYFIWDSLRGKKEVE